MNAYQGASMAKSLGPSISAINNVHSRLVAENRSSGDGSLESS